MFNHSIKVEHMCQELGDPLESQATVWSFAWKLFLEFLTGLGLSGGLVAYIFFP